MGTTIAAVLGGIVAVLAAVLGLRRSAKKEGKREAEQTALQRSFDDAKKAQEVEQRNRDLSDRDRADKLRRYTRD